MVMLSYTWRIHEVWNQSNMICFEFQDIFNLLSKISPKWKLKHKSYFQAKPDTEMLLLSDRRSQGFNEFFNIEHCQMEKFKEKILFGGGKKARASRSWLKPGSQLLSKIIYHFVPDLEEYHSFHKLNWTRERNITKYRSAIRLKSKICLEWGYYRTHCVQWYAVWPWNRQFHCLTQTR